MGKITTNAEEAKSNKLFRMACKMAGTEPTRRQFSKWRNGKGLAVAFKISALAKRG